MRLAILFLGIFSTSAAFADSSCQVLSAAVGTYKLVSNNCPNIYWFNPYPVLEVVGPDKVQSESGEVYFQFWIWNSPSGVDSGGSGWGPSTQRSDIYKCTTSYGGVNVEEPNFQTYFSFLANKASYSRLNCSATFEKQ